ncbi:MAG TPA: hypothetical protein VEK35_04190 [Roseiarcus sp.]|nr:hypothetical protein [Roseiarcus sp.]
MTIRLVLGAVLAIGLATSADAAMLAPPAIGESVATPIAEGCGPGGWRGPYGHCHYGAYGGAGWWRPCPPGMHLGPYGHRCWPN